MKRIAWRAALFVGTLALSGTVVGVAHAQNDARSTATPTIESMLALYPGSVQLDADTVQVRPGIEVHLAAKQGEIGTLASGCSQYRVCFYEHTNYGGQRIDLYDCEMVKLTSIPYNDGSQGRSGAHWGNRASSIINNQVETITQRRTTLFNDRPTPVAYLGYINFDYVAPDLRSFAMEPHASRVNVNDKIDRVDVCK